MEKDIFDKRKIDVLAKKDKSNIGKIDLKIGNLVNLINSSDNFYTTSSCSGRIVIFKNSNNYKKNCEFLYTSHKKILKKDILKILDLIDKCYVEDDFEIWLKFEPIIIHVSCDSLLNAKKLINLANLSGFRRAGIIALKNSIVVEIVGTEFLETILKDNFGKYYDEKIFTRLIYYSNKKMQVNFEKIKRFEKNFKLKK
ncbi:MAG: tRNA wybutosine-synthesizing 3 family protein [Candidatus Woesearchaeota archaeon]